MAKKKTPKTESEPKTTKTAKTTTTETVKPSQKFYIIDLTDATAKKIEQASQAVAKLAEVDGLSAYVKGRLLRESVHIHVSAIYAQREAAKAAKSN